MKMKVYGILIFISLILTASCEDEEEIKELSSIVRNFTARFAARLITPPYGSTDNFIFSGLRIISTLATMYTLGSDNIKSEIKPILGLTSSLEENICDVMNILTNYDPINESVAGVLFDSKLFYRLDMKIRDEAVRNPCISGKVQALNFTDTKGAMETINKFYDVWGYVNRFRKFFSRYLTTPLAANTNEFFMNLLRVKTVMQSPFYFGWYVTFIDINGVEANTFSMEKIDNFYFEHYEKHNVTLIREDLVGGRFSYVVIVPNYKSPECQAEFESFLQVDVFTDILLEAASLRNKTRMGLRMPELEKKSRFDLKNILNEMGLTSLGEVTAFSGLTGDFSNITEFPYSEFIQFVSSLQSNPILDNRIEYFEVTKPFIFVRMDNKFAIPLQTFLYTGINKYKGLY